jgi:hypothetical protein
LFLPSICVVKSSFIKRVTATHVNSMIPSPPFRFHALGDVCERVWWTTPDLNPTQWTPKPYTRWLRFVLEWLMVCGVLCGVCGVLCGVCGVWCLCYGPCWQVGLVDGRVLLSQAWRQSRWRDRVVALVVGRVDGWVLSTGGSCCLKPGGRAVGETMSSPRWWALSAGGSGVGVGLVDGAGSGLSAWAGLVGGGGGRLVGVGRACPSQ